MMSRIVDATLDRAAFQDLISKNMDGVLVFKLVQIGVALVKEQTTRSLFGREDASECCGSRRRRG